MMTAWCIVFGHSDGDSVVCSVWPGAPILLFGFQSLPAILQRQLIIKQTKCEEVSQTLMKKKVFQRNIRCTFVVVDLWSSLLKMDICKSPKQGHEHCHFVSGRL